jgi:hypothetical protein
MIKKKLLKTIVDIFLENPNKSNMMHSTILELFDYLTKEPNRKIANHMIQMYSEILFKAPKYEHYFTSFVEQYDEKSNKYLNSAKTYKLGGPNSFDYYNKQQRETLRKQDEDLIKFGERSSNFKGGMDDDEKYN